MLITQFQLMKIISLEVVNLFDSSSKIVQRGQVTMMMQDQEIQMIIGDYHNLD